MSLMSSLLLKKRILRKLLPISSFRMRMTWGWARILVYFLKITGMPRRLIRHVNILNYFRAGLGFAEIRTIVQEPFFHARFKQRVVAEAHSFLTEALMADLKREQSFHADPDLMY